MLTGRVVARSACHHNVHVDSRVLLRQSFTVKGPGTLLGAHVHLGDVLGSDHRF